MNIEDLLVSNPFHDDTERDTFACVCWTPEDVMDAAEEQGVAITYEQAEGMIYELEETLEERMIEHGWDIISSHVRGMR